ncbi:MAG: response regulator transcription factor [Lachnospiraceae bacterium]|nr:response regulator transcription factor [Lachnospiraceae bacterium]
MRIAICEDDKTEQQRLIAYLEEEFALQSLSAEVFAYENGETLVEAAGQKPVQIYFEDDWQSGISGIKVAQHLRVQDKTAGIVFVTSSRDYFKEGFSVGAQHYLLKPYTKGEVYEALERCLRQVGGIPRYIELTVNRKKRRILFSELCWVESRDKVCQIHLVSEELRSYIRLSRLEQMLDDPRFLRCHRSFLVNMDRVTGMKNGFFCMSDEIAIPVKRAERAHFREIYEDYLFEKMKKGGYE